MKLSLKIKDDFDIEVSGSRYGVNLNVYGVYDTDQMTEAVLDQKELKAFINLLEQFKEEE